MECNFEIVGILGLEKKEKTFKSLSIPLSLNYEK
jgi:hypothetical protein